MRIDSCFCFSLLTAMALRHCLGAGEVLELCFLSMLSTPLNLRLAQYLGKVSFSLSAPSNCASYFQTASERALMVSGCTSRLARYNRCYQACSTVWWGLDGIHIYLRSNHSFTI
ncbi:uncharacterized protein N7479_010371 [Penicillium vulpinum]|uniref:uncharacterized protein n=1 Tax=Penicillium vulpinum TaxID=29845 RepID=UPI002547D090|nr:uncharacterized protein N7479_010371 [Penicillium vulpinum]KAJ5951958.1 hypothetical protein N7479_010371 [Penicillium vulpinum]